MRVSADFSNDIKFDGMLLFHAYRMQFADLDRLLSSAHAINDRLTHLSSRALCTNGCCTWPSVRETLRRDAATAGKRLPGAYKWLFAHRQRLNGSQPTFKSAFSATVAMSEQLEDRYESRASSSKCWQTSASFSH